jgi:phospholipase C
MTNWDRWQKTLTIVNYDENGGFFDHVKPLPIATKPRPGATFTYGPFATTGPRVPAYLISPFVKPGAVYSGNLDHTSVLKCIAKRFGNGSRSPAVDARPVGNILDALELDAPRGDDADGAAKANAASPADAQQKFPEIFRHFENL